MLATEQVAAHLIRILQRDWKGDTELLLCEAAELQIKHFPVQSGSRQVKLLPASTGQMNDSQLVCVCVCVCCPWTIPGDSIESVKLCFYGGGIGSAAQFYICK